MNNTEKLNRIKTIIDSCVTYDQVKTCFSFINRDEFFSHKEMGEKYKVLLYLQNKIYTLRNVDIKEHIDFSKNYLKNYQK